MPSKEARVILSHQRLVSQIRQRVAEYADKEWRGLGSWRDADVDRFVAKVTPVVETGQKQVYQLTQNYLDSIARLSGRTPAPTTTLAAYPRGVPIEEVYTRPFTHVWWKLSEGKNIGEAVEEAAARLDNLVSTDMQMANVLSGFDKLSGDKRAIGYLRVLNETDATCELCVIASTQRYSTEDLMPIHPGCQCDVAPLYSDEDAAAADEVNADRYAAAQERIAEQGVEGTHSSDTSFRDLTQIKVRDHGEVGPLLTWKDQAFTGPDDVPKPPTAQADGTIGGYRKTTPEELAATGKHWTN